MKLDISNIGIIKKGTIELNGLTIIASENDSGKSTAGKVLHCIIDTINTFEKSYFETVEQGLNSRFENLIKIFKVDYFEGEMGEYFQEFKTNLLKIQFKAIENIRNQIFSENHVKLRFEELEENIIANVNGFIGSGELKENFIEIESMLKKLLIDLKNFYNSNNDFTRAKNMIFTKELKIEFETGISNIFFNETQSEISIEQADGNNCKLKIVDNNVVECNLAPKNLRLEEFKTNVIYIDSPIILDYIDEIKSANNRFFFHHTLFGQLTKNPILSNKNKKINNLYRMLSKKVEINIADELVNKTEYNNLIANIQNIILGNIEYSQEDDNFFYKKNNKKIELKNTAMGIKAFGIFQILLNTRDINKNTLLIIDEPEVHLHPKWQIKYAKIIVLLVKELGLKVLLNSHSPFFIEAIEKYSKKYNLLDKTNYYTSIKDPSGEFAIIQNVNDSLEKIYSLQAAAYDELDNDTMGEL